jgi:putative oxidoreductase
MKPVYQSIALRIAPIGAATLKKKTMKTATLIIRIATGLMFVVSSAKYFLNMMPEAELSGPTLDFVAGLDAAGYFMPFLKVVELVGGLALIAGRFVSLATVVLFPVTLNIFLFHAFLAPDGMVIPILLLAANLYLAFAHRDRYRPILQP